MLTRDFKDTVRARIARDAAFREALQAEVVECTPAGEPDRAKSILHRLVDAVANLNDR